MLKSSEWRKEVERMKVSFDSVSFFLAFCLGGVLVHPVVGVVFYVLRAFFRRY